MHGRSLRGSGVVVALVTTVTIGGWPSSATATVQAPARQVEHAIDLGRIHGYHVELDAGRGAIRSHTGAPVRPGVAAKPAGAVTLRVARRGAHTIYRATGVVSRDRIALRTPLATIDLRFVPARTFAPEPWCGGRHAERARGTYLGRFRFRGERGYARIRAHLLLGERRLTPRSCGAQAAGDIWSRAATGTILTAVNSTTHTRVHVYARPGDRSSVYVLDHARRGRLKIRRYAFARAGSGVLAIAPDQSSASLGPVAPLLHGAAQFVAPSAWTGDLTANLIGDPSAALAGPGFSASIDPG